MFLNRTIIRFLFTASVLLLILFAFSYPFLEPGSGAYVVGILSLLPILLTLLGTVILLVTGWDNRVTVDGNGGR